MSRPLQRCDHLLAQERVPRALAAVVRHLRRGQLVRSLGSEALGSSLSLSAPFFLDHALTSALPFSLLTPSFLSQELARAHPSEVTVLSPRAFFWPLWSPSQLELVHDPSTPSSPSAYDFEATGQFAYHAWESKAHLWLDALTPRGVEAGGSAFERMVKAFSTTEDEQAYRKWEVLAQVSARS